MAYFDGFTANLFGRTADGRRVIAPFGPLGRVYAVPADADAARITRGVQGLYAALIAGVAATQLTAGWRGYAVTGPALLLGFYLGMHALTRRLPPAGVGARDLVAPGRAEQQARVARAFGRGWLYGLAAVSGTMAVAAAALWWPTREPALLPAAAFFAACGGVFARQAARARTGTWGGLP
jgi:hypothetical protein